MIISRVLHGRLSSLFLWLLITAPTWAEERSAASLLPVTTVFYAEMLQPLTVIELVRSHRLRTRIENLQQTKHARESKKYLEFKALVAVVEAKLGRTWPRILQTAARGGISVGVDAETQGLAVLVNATDDETLPQLIATLIELAGKQAESEYRPAPIKSVEYRGLAVHEIGEAKVANFGHWLLLTNNSDLGKRVLDNYLDPTVTNLSLDESFQRAHASSAPDVSVWSYVNVALLRDRGVAKELFEGRTDNPLAELILGGVLDSLKRTPYATASLTADADRLSLQLAIPHQEEWTTEARQYFFGPAGAGAAPAVLPVDDPLLSISAYRDISAMWLHAGDLFKERMVDELAKADSSLTTLFSGKDFGDEILGAVGPEIQLVVARQSFAEKQFQPAIKLPAFAAIFRLKNPQAMQPEFRRIFQSLVGFLNIAGSMNGQPQLDLDLEKSEAGQIVSATYVVDAAETDQQGLKINYNFSPSIVFARDYFVVSSARDLARQLIPVLSDGARTSLTANTLANANLKAVHDLLSDNRDQLIAQNMLNEGHSKEEAEVAISDLLSLVAAIREISLELTRHDDHLQLELTSTFSQTK